MINVVGKVLDGLHLLSSSESDSRQEFEAANIRTATDNSAGIGGFVEDFQRQGGIYLVPPMAMRSTEMEATNSGNRLDGSIEFVGRHIDETFPILATDAARIAGRV